MATDAYEPRPIDVTNVVLSSELTGLTEKLAENTHDLWARERVAQGWKLGPKRNDETKEHPSLIAYGELSESEKRFDRETALGTLKAILAMGYAIHEPRGGLVPAGAIGSGGSNLEAWIAGMEGESAAVTARGSLVERKWRFDMDDEPELASLPKSECPITHEALSYLQAKVYPAWKEADANAIKQQRCHKSVATVAIWTGIAALLCSILQLVIAHVYPGGEFMASVILHHCETVAITLAAAAVAIGFWLSFHHGWLDYRQRAERLRVLKFQSLSWPELWCDLAEWKKRVERQMSSNDEAREPSLDLPEIPSCVVSPAEVAAISALYRVKRLEFQRHYFEHQSEKANPRSKIADWKVGLWIFVASVAVVLLHRLWHPAGEHAAFYSVIVIGLATTLPVVGFGLRAWLAAFETPRSRNLFRAKALALNDYINRTIQGGSNLHKIVRAIAQGEHFFANEHREWCRLQSEAEWFV